MQRVLIDKISKNVYLLRLNDENTKYFEGLWYIPEGISYNAYVATLPEGVVLFDGWKHVYGELYVETLRQIVDFKDIKYVVVHHTEPDHSGSLKSLFNHVKNATILGHSFAIQLIQVFYGKLAEFRSVNDGEVVKIGKEYAIHFYHVPWLHWPDTVVSFLTGDNVLFTCDVFGSYGIPSKVFYEELTEEEKTKFRWFTQKYFANVIGHYVDWVIKNLEKLSQLNLDVKIIAPGHGPLHKEFNNIVTLYKALGSRKISPGKTIIIYTSMYKFVEDAVRIVVEELSRKGVNYRVYKFTDTYRDPESDIIGDVFDAENIILATSTYESDVFPLAKYIIDLLKMKVPSNKKILVMSVYGWGPVAGRKIMDSLMEKGFQVVGSLELKGSPSMYEEKIRTELNKLIP
ncbi:MAG: FprA family A-type flavoprotein [Desulfurococcaceae archaeon]